MHSTKIFLAEDDQRLAALVSDFLRSHDYEVVTEERGDAVETRVFRTEPDLLILDVGLPGKNGLDVCRDIRVQFDNPILILTARNSDADQILGLEYGADDYVIKPVDPQVLLARVKALLRRHQNERDIAPVILRFNHLTIKCGQRQALMGEDTIALSSHEFDLLLELARNAGKVLSREHLFKTVYHREYDGLDRSVDVRISQLRKKLYDDTESPERIKTVWGRGYLFVAEAW